MLLIKNGRVIDPASKTDAALDVLLDGGRISENWMRIFRRTARKFSTRRD